MTTSPSHDIVLYARTGRELADRVGEIISAGDAEGAATLILLLDDHARETREVQEGLSWILRDHWRLRGGSKTFQLGGAKVVLGTTESTTYDAEKLAAGLRAAGMPDDAIAEIVVEKITVTVSVDARRAKQAAAANPAYAAAVEAASDTVTKDPSVRVTPAG